MVKIFVCVSCRQPGGEENDAPVRPGETLASALENRVAAQAVGDRISVCRVECLAVCDQPCTIALSGEDKWGYVIGNIDPAAHADETFDAALKLVDAPNGIVPLRERPPSFRKGVVARIPPLAFEGKRP
jgi:predicted metal-binding protein